MKFLCDEMFKGLARWLRAAGYDTTLEADGTPDARLLEQARVQGRLLLTRDRRFVDSLVDRRGVLLLEGEGLGDYLDTLGRLLPISWLHDPFSRCLNCNARLREASAERWREVPTAVRKTATQLRYCPGCRQLYWDGSHVEHMRAYLRRAEARRLAGKPVGG
jgi:uncharacterized protein